MKQKDFLVWVLNGLWIIILCGVIFGAFEVQFFEHELPCPLCMLQRLAMLGVGAGALLNLRFGVRPFHYGISMLFALFGAAVSLTQMMLHICPQFPTYGKMVGGLSLYTWAFIVFVGSIFAIAILSMLYDKSHDTPPKQLQFFSWFAFALLFFTTLSNAITTFTQCGLGACE